MGGFKSRAILRFPQVGQLAGRNVFYIRFAPVERIYFFRIRIETHYPEAHLIEAQEQRQAHIAQADDPHQGLFGLDFF